VNPRKVVEKGYYPCTKNILYVRIFCDPLGINISSPSEALHTILLGHDTRLLNAFARLEKSKLINQAQEDNDEDSSEDEEDSVKNRGNE